MFARLCVVLAILGSNHGNTASADTRSWRALKGRLPANTFVVVGADLAPIGKTTAHQTLIEVAFAKNPGVKEVLDDIKTVCAIDLTTAISDLTIAVGPDDNAIMAFGLTGAGQRKALSCLQAMATHQGKGAVTARTSGKITEYTVDGVDKKLYVAWLAKDVFAMTNESSTPTQLQTVLKAKGVKGEMAKALRRITLKAPAWFALTSKAEPVTGVEHLKFMFGALTMKGSILDVTATCVLDSAAAATAMVVDGTQALIAVKQGAEQNKLTELGKVLATLGLSARGPEATVSISVEDTAIPALLPEIATLF